MYVDDIPIISIITALVACIFIIITFFSGRKFIRWARLKIAINAKNPTLKQRELILDELKRQKGERAVAILQKHYDM